MPHEPAFRLTFPEPDIALLTFDRPDMGANVLSQHVLEEFAGHLDALEKRNGLAGLIVVSGKPGIFIAGADLREFLATMGAPADQVVAIARQGQELFARLSRTPFVTVAAIDGICVGGGAELAVWCDRRIMTSSPKTEIGFPEVKLGLFPGWGGTVRTPRIVGLGNAVEMITSGESISPADALNMGLVSDVVPAEKLQKRRSILFAWNNERAAISPTAKRGTPRCRSAKPNSVSSAQRRRPTSVGKPKGNYPAPEAALEMMLGAATADAKSACQMEAEGFAPLFGSPVNRALLNVFFLTDRNKKDTGVDGEVASRKIERAGILGAGIMGAGIAAANVKRDVPTLMGDADAASLKRGVQGVIKEVAYNRQTKKPDADRAIQYAPLLQAASDLKGLAGCDLVIEAIVENLDVKRKVFAQLEPLLPEHAILASNTSTIPITKLAEELKRPERFCGIHFFNPVRQMKLVEVIRGAKTSDETIATAVAYAKRLGKMPIVVERRPRLSRQSPAVSVHERSARAARRRGRRSKQIDKAAVKLRHADGADRAVRHGRPRHGALRRRDDVRSVSRPRCPLADSARAWSKLGRLGQKTGKGFYAYENKKGKARARSRHSTPILETYVRGEQKSTSPTNCTVRLFLPMLLEATRVLEEHKCARRRATSTSA